MSDDGIGPRVVERLGERRLPDGIEPLVLGEDALTLLAYLDEGTGLMLIVDSVRMGREPGSWAWFTPEEVETIKPAARFSTHEGDVLRIVQLAQDLGCRVPPIRIFGFEPERLEPGFDLSATLNDRFDEYVDEVLEELRRFLRTAENTRSE